MGTELDVEQRRNKILELLSTQGKVKVSFLSKTFGVSEVSIRSDLAALEEMGLLSRVHGGAIGASNSYYGMSFSQRKKTNRQEKQAIANKACEYVEENETVMINSGTTSLLFYRALTAKFKNLTFVTNSIAIALESHGNVILLGGKINGEYQFTYGADTRSQIENYHADKVFLSVDGITASDGFSSYYEEDVDILRVMIENSAQTYVLADYTKIGRNAFVKVDGADRIDCLVTNEKPDPELEKLKKLGVRIEFA